MDWIQFSVFFIGNIVFTLTLWLWSRSESNTDRRDMMGILRELKDEMKDFHGKLIAIEERSRK